MTWIQIHVLDSVKHVTCPSIPRQRSWPRRTSRITGSTNLTTISSIRFLVAFNSCYTKPNVLCQIAVDWTFARWNFDRGHSSKYSYWLLGCVSPTTTTAFHAIHANWMLVPRQESWQWSWRIQVFLSAFEHNQWGVDSIWSCILLPLR